MADEFDFDADDLKPQERPVKYKGKSYVLREASEDAATQYRNAAVSCAKMVDGKVTGVIGIANAEPLLVSLCLFEVLPNSDVKNTCVQVGEVRAMLARVVKPMFEWVKKVSDLGEDETVESLERGIQESQEKLSRLKSKQESPAKNDLSATDGTSA